MRNCSYYRRSLSMKHLRDFWWNLYSQQKGLWDYYLRMSSSIYFWGIFISNAYSKWPQRSEKQIQERKPVKKRENLKNIQEGVQVNSLMILSDAGISRETFYDWMNPKREFSDNFTREMQEEFIARINAAKVYPRIGCKRTLSQAWIRGDRRAAIEYLKRTDPDYKDKQETTLKGDTENPVQIFIPDNWRWPKK